MKGGREALRRDEKKMQLRLLKLDNSFVLNLSFAFQGREDGNSDGGLANGNFARDDLSVRVFVLVVYLVCLCRRQMGVGGCWRGAGWLLSSLF